MKGNFDDELFNIVLSQLYDNGGEENSKDPLQFNSDEIDHNTYSPIADDKLMINSLIYQEGNNRKKSVDSDQKNDMSNFYE